MPMLSAQKKSFPELLADLFATRFKPDGQPFTNTDLANWICDNIPGAEISESYISRMRQGDKRNPSRDVLLYLCLAFKVPPSYFFPEVQHLNPTEQLDNSTLLRMALRANGLDDETQKSLEVVIRKLRRATRAAKQNKDEVE
jgi:transcriptional regulator with XRE-family HTH domain